MMYLKWKLSQGTSGTGPEGVIGDRGGHAEASWAADAAGYRIGYSWDGTGFAAPEPFPSWTLDENYTWQPPTPMPDDGNFYVWDEATTSWVEADDPE